MKGVVDVNLVVAASDLAVGMQARVAALSSALEDARFTSGWVAAESVGSPILNDERLLEAASAHERVRAQLTALPPVTGEDSVARVLRGVADGACRVVRLTPALHRYPLTDWMLAPLPEACDREGVALAIDYGDAAPDWRELLVFAGCYPTLPVILLGAEVGADRAVFAALEVAPNILLDLSKTQDDAALDRAMGTFGNHRFLYGSGGDAPRPPDPTRAPLAIDALRRDNALALDRGAWREEYL